MTDHARLCCSSSPRPAGHCGLGLALGVMLVAAGCQGVVSVNPGATGAGGTGSTGAGAGTGNTGGTGAGAETGNAGGAGAGAGTGNTGGTGPTACTGTEVLMKKRVVRLTFNQIANSIRALLDTTVADKIAADFEIVDAAHRTFPPLSNTREGAVVTDNVWDIGDRMAQAAAKYVLDNFTAVTKCATATDTCAQQFLRDFGAKALRRPLTAEETADFTKVYTDLKGFGGTVQEATQYGVYAVLDSPGFLYRTELGGNPTTMGPLSQLELASEIAYFLTDAQPDPTLLGAATGSALATSEQIRAQVDRILVSAPARLNLEGAMMSYFSIPSLDLIVIDPGKFPNWGPGLRNSMYRESEEFIRDTLWTGKLNDLLTSRKTRINTTLAPVYGVAPPVGAQTENDFLPVELPATRSGMLTQAGFLVARARPQAGSVVGRGLLVNAAFLCNVNPEFPDALAETIAAANKSLEGKTEKEKAAYRADPTTLCASCHVNFDAYGLALETFDTIGQYRTLDEQMRTIDASVKLPALAGGATVADAAAMGAALAGGGAFANCIAKNVISYALAETAVGTGTNACATRAVVDRFNGSDGTFTALVREIAMSQTLAVRAPGGAQ